MKKLTGKILLMTLLLVIFVMNTASAAAPATVYEEAQTLLSQNKYAEAAEKFAALGSYEDASLLAMYCRACALCEAGEYEKGIEVLTAMGNYKDCPYRVAYYEAQACEAAAGEDDWLGMIDACEMYLSTSVYYFLDSQERINTLNERISALQATQYAAAIEAGEAGNYTTCINALRSLAWINYSDSSKRYAYYTIRRAEQNASDYTSLIAVANDYLSMGTYLDCAERAAVVNAKATAIQDGKYDAAVVLMLEKKYGEAASLFRELQDYKDSASLMEICEEKAYGKELSLSGQGFASKIHILVKVDDEGIIGKIEVDSSNETSGFGTRCGKDEAFLAQFIGKTLPLTETVDVLSGATVTSNAIIDALKNAPVAAVEETPAGGVLLCVTGKGFQSDVMVNVTLDENNTILAIEVQSGNETPGFGTRCGEDEAFLSQFIGKKLPLTEDVDVLSGATVTSNAIIDALRNAIP